MEERNKRLFRNLFVIGVGTVISKVTQYVVLAFCTYWMTTGEYGIADLCASTSALLVPIVTIDIAQAAFRFSKNDNRSGLITFGMLISFLGPSLCFLLLPLSHLFPRVGEYWAAISFLVLMESLYGVLKEYTRGNERSKTYVAGGIINAAVQVVACLLFVYVFKMGVEGYIFALVAGYFFEIVFLFFALRVFSMLRFSSISKSEVKEYLKFSLPLMPNTLMWWIISVSDRYFILFMIGDSATGIYSVAAKIPALVSIVSTLFFKAWEISAISEKSSSDRGRYSSDMFERISLLVALSISALFVLLRALLKIMVSSEFFESWQFATVLIAAAGYASCQSFVGTTYTVEKDSIGCLKTTCFTAVVNILLNLLMIHLFGIMGAAVATLISYILVLVYRLVDTRKYVALSVNWVRFSATFAIITIESFGLALLPDWYYLISTLCFAIIVIINYRKLKSDFTLVIRSLFKRREGV